MTFQAHDIAAALRERIPGLPVKKLHKLLYYCQGHHLATFGSPLFDESIMAYDMGPLVAKLWRAEKDERPRPDPAPLSERELNTVGYVVSRYGRLTGRDLELLTHAEEPWQRANSNRPPGTSVRIEQEWIRAFFESSEGDEDLGLDAVVVKKWLAGASERLSDDLQPDDLEGLRRRLADAG